MTVPAGWALKSAVRGALRLYKVALSPWLKPNCRFLPTCSTYMAEAVIAHGVLKGGWLGMRRLCRCHPWGGSGYDPVPAAPKSASGRTWKCET